MKEFDKRSQHFLFGHHFINSHKHSSRLSINIVGRKLMLVHLGTWRVKRRKLDWFSFCEDFWDHFWGCASQLLASFFPCRHRGRSRIFFRRGCTRLLLYFNTNKPHSFFWQNTSCIRKPQVISGGGEGGCTPCTLPLDLPLHQ